MGCRRIVVALFALSLVAAACGDDEDLPARSGDVTEDGGTTSDDGAGDAAASFEEPQDGDTVARRFPIAMSAEGIEIQPAAEGVNEGAGHFHVMIDTPCLEEGETIPNDDQHVHFGAGQQEGQLFLEPGEHELCLQVADGAHTALDVVDEITVTVDGDLPYVTLGVPEGETLTSPVAVTMEAHAFEIQPAAEGVNDGAGHFHVMIDTPCLDEGETIPNDEQHRHFGDGSTSAELALEPGAHVLCLQLGDGAHTALPITHAVQVTVG